MKNRGEIELIRSTLFNLINLECSKYNQVTEEIVNKSIEQLEMFAAYKSLTIEDVENIKKEMLATFTITEGKISTLDESVHKKWFNDKKYKIDFQYWDRYKEYLRKKMFNVNSVENILFEIADHLGDPTIDASFERKGLVIGDVQSGKTANYIGLMNIGADIGYKVIILLAGTVEELRKQTQIRVNEGMIGVDNTIQGGERKVGVGKIKSEPRAVGCTNTENDFKRASMVTSITSVNQPLVLVVKKNVKVLENIIQWLKSSNMLASNAQIPSSLLVIDDEADYASINTNKKDDDSNPTMTNNYIREILSLFQKSSYLGFTATPYANVFIAPDIKDYEVDEQNRVKKVNADLFPKDYIACLTPPSNYIGARNIFMENAEYRDMIVTIDQDIEDYLPYNHKKDAIVGDELPESLKESISTFILFNTIQDLENKYEKNPHRSMLINISRFINIQNELAKIVEEYVKACQREIKLHSKMYNPEEHSYISSLEHDYFKIYGNTEFYSKHKWTTILNQLNQSVSPIAVKVANSSNKRDKINYNNGDSSIRVIAIGGIALSRGLTLEGLAVSYFRRNVMAYDTLMQMGRWFGYRDGYQELCKIFMQDETKNQFENIREATDMLLDDIQRMKDLGGTPSDFGLRVKYDSEMHITSLNKMRDTQTVRQYTLPGYIFEVKRYSLSNEILSHNVELFYSFYKKISIYAEKEKVIKNVPSQFIIEFLKGYKDEGSSLNVDAILEYLTSTDELKNWDVKIMSGESSVQDEQTKLKYVTRSFKVKNEETILQLNKSRLGSMSDGSFGLTEKEIKEIERITGKPKNKLNQRDYFYTETFERNPLMLIYPIKPNYSNESADNKVSEFLVGYSLGFPTKEIISVKSIPYRLNPVAIKQLEEAEEGNDDEE